MSITSHLYDYAIGRYPIIAAADLPVRYHDDALLAGYALFTDRTLQRTHPAGATDRAGRWYPTADERRPCCDRIRSSSRAWGLSLLRHCRTAGHVAALMDVDPHLLRSLIAHLARRQAPARTAPTDLCLQCGASWFCAHMPTMTRGVAPPHGEDSALRLVPDSRADMNRHGPVWR